MRSYSIFFLTFLVLFCGTACTMVPPDVIRSPTPQMTATSQPIRVTTLTTTVPEITANSQVVEKTIPAPTPTRMPSTTATATEEYSVPLQFPAGRPIPTRNVMFNFNILPNGLQTAPKLLTT
jgi:hypothetical protein